MNRVKAIVKQKNHTIFRDCVIITWKGGQGNGDICPKTKSYPPLINQKLISTPRHIMIILRLPLCWISSSGTNITSNDSTTYVEESFEESSESLDSELVSSSHELGYSSPSTASLALRFPRAWVRTQEFLSDWALFLKFNLIILCFIYHTLNLYCCKNFNSWIFHSAQLWCHVC